MGRGRQCLTKDVFTRIKLYLLLIMVTKITKGSTENNTARK